MTLSDFRIFFIRLLGYERLEVINPERGTNDAEAEAHKGEMQARGVAFEFSFLLLTCSRIPFQTNSCMFYKP